MKFSCTKENLQQAIALCGGLTSKNVHLPVLNNVLIRADDQKVVLVATNLEAAIVVTIRSKIESAGSFTVPARVMAEFISLLSGERVDIELQGAELLVGCGKTQTKIKGQPDDDFPVIPAVDGGVGYVVSGSSLSAQMARVFPAVAKNEIRPELSGVFFGFNLNNSNTLVLAATDSYRLAESRLTVEQGEGERKLILPGRTVSELNHVIASGALSGEESQVRFLVNDTQVAVHYGNVQVVSRVVDGAYPDYTQIIPQQFKTTAVVSVDQLKKELRAAGLFTTSGVNAVSLQFDITAQIIRLGSASLQTGDYQSEISAEVTGENMSVVLNHRYVLDGLQGIATPTVKIQLVNSDSPCVFGPTEHKDGFLYIVMPVRQ